MRIVFIGPPGAGKGTQSANLVEHLQIPHVSTGDMLRMAISARSPVGQAAQQYMSSGQLVPDPIILQVVGERLEQPDCAGGILFDGFPRTVRQAEALDESLAERGAPLDVVLELRVHDAVVIDRLSKANRGRDDDDPKTIANRLRAYWNQTRPLLEYYRERGLLETVDGSGSPAEVFDRIKQVLAARRT